MATLTALPRAPLSSLLGTAGSSLTTAQTQLGAVVGLSSGMVISDVTLEIRAAVSRNAAGELEIEPLSAAHLVGDINASAISTVRVNFAATAAEPVGIAQAPVPPTSDPKLVADRFRQRDDMLALERIMGPLDVKATYLKSGSRWLVSATDTEGRLVREQLVSD